MTTAQNGDDIKPGDRIIYVGRYTGDPNKADTGIYIKDDPLSPEHCYIIDPSHNKVREIWIRRDSITNRVNSDYRDMDPAFIRQLHGMPADDEEQDRYENSLFDFDYYF